jgi:predicted MFS family arabinose efflux permease
VRYPWTSPPILALFAVALIMGCFFVVRLLTAPEPLIPISILRHPIVRCAIAANAFGWGSIIGLNILLPMYLQRVTGLSPTSAGLSLILFMVSLNASAGLAGQVLGRVRHYKLLPMLGLLLSAGAVTTLAWQADRLTPLSFEVLVILIGIGFGPLPSLTSVAMQNVVPRHQLGISVGTMNFSRNLYATILIAVFGAIALAAAPTGELLGGSAETYGRAFFVAAGSLLVALIALALMEEKPLQGAEIDAR